MACLLWPLSLLYAAIFAVRTGLYRLGWLRTERVPVPVIVVGNVIAGGAGKTPVVMAVVQHLRARGLQVGVVSRGYGRRTDDCREVLGDSDPLDVGDEPALIHHATRAPVFVARKRIEAARALLARHPATQVIVSDDGLQHLALARDIEICVFDDRGIGNGWRLPAGPLREAWPRKVDLVLHSGARPAFAGGFTATRRLANEALAHDGSRVPLDSLVGRPVIALAAIARPEAFFDMLRARGLTLAETIALPDHHDFDGWQRPDAPGHTLVCTEKDAVKLWRRAPDALAVPLEFAPSPEFFNALDAKLSSPDGYQAA
ncbi:tetraacyldisaccharide 4'-kinase [Variovorax sp. J22G73]|jgi:tetraacyldisaccharide 4'-kinase|uniref:tetraacyldisaccharide 4'-kinase n=1 Tax=unclassified Variovorax TaxID=663243 RepID=UPI000D5D4415|nr:MULTISPECIES: tetraacyldisaccharide 4'-kinase [unclassified Variovorax]MDM0003269.1 tetraacyldisaccharide 4'-kinase [Variovorax sp. J22R203]MDM0097065.1 tetraacyldisaccharide 4'-kinase [Variovorax sp. J22G73]